MTKAILEPEQEKEIQMEIVPLANRTTSLVVKNHADRATLVEDVKKARALKVHYEETLHLDANTTQARELYEATRDTRDRVYKPIDAFIKAAGEAVKKFDTAETLRIQNEQREAEERQAQKEREEKARREAEAKALEEAEERRQLEEFERLEKEKKEKEAILASATESGNSKIAGIAAKEVAKLENAIEITKAEGEKKLEEIRESAEVPPTAPAISFNKPAPAAPIKKLIWKARATNMMKLCRSIGNGDVPFNVVEISQSKLNDFAKSYDGKTKIDGLEFYQEAAGRI